MKKIRKNSKYIAVIPYDDTYKGTKKRFIKSYRPLNKLKPNLIAVSYATYPVLKDNYKNVRIFTNPKYDLLYSELNNKRKNNMKWDKLSGKKVVLWTTIHGHGRWGTFTEEICIDIYFEKILSYFNSHKSMALIFRPHPMLIEEFVDIHKIWTKEDLNRIKEFINNAENMIWDDSEDFTEAYLYSDALITEATTGINFSYLVTQNPICILNRSKNEEVHNNDVFTENYYKAYDWDDLEKYLDMVSKKEDRLLEKRIGTLDTVMPNFDGKNTERLCDYIENKFVSQLGSSCD